MRIVLLSNLYPPYVLGGAEILARDYVQQLEALGHEVTVLTSDYGVDHPRKEGQVWRTLRYTEAAHFDGHRSILQKVHQLYDYYRGFHDPANARQLQQTIEEVQPDILYIWEITGLGVISIMQTLPHIQLPIVFHLGNYWLQYALSPQTEQTRVRMQGIKKLLIGKVPEFQYTSLIAVSEAVKQEYVRVGCDEKRIEVIYNGIDARFVEEPRHQQDKSQTGIHILYVGRLCAEKGVLVLFKALDSLVHTHQQTDIHLHICGDGDASYIQELEAFLHQKELNDYVKFYGRIPQSELIEQYDRADIMVIPSLWKEPFGLVVAEAMARGLPTIASATGGPAEIITNSVNGLLVEPDNEEELSRAILQLIEKPETRTRLARAAQATVRERFMIESNARKVERHLQRALAQTTTPDRDQLVEKVSQG